MKLLVYRPDSPSVEKATGVLWIHGGGYVTGIGRFEEAFRETKEKYFKQQNR